MKKLIILSALFLFCSKSYSQAAKDSVKPSANFTLKVEESANKIVDRRLIGIQDIDYVIVDGVIMQHGFRVDPDRGILHLEVVGNSTITIIFKP